MFQILGDSLSNKHLREWLKVWENNLVNKHAKISIKDKNLYLKILYEFSMFYITIK